MDLYKNIERIKNMLLYTCGCSIEDAIIVCEETKKLLQYILQKQKENKVETPIITRGYKITRFKKPTSLTDEKKVYQRVCRRCEEVYRTTSKHSFFCDKCKRNSFSNQVYEKPKH